ncbi:hypothetical protein ACFGVS_24680 [Mucilaginibacter sp. AW1-7]|uniref:hypothetical protein n=1 Tax=Mucilaginibacter sp. AW1-7 TaxID=3349874 RepID=UPI003F7405E6
MSEETQITSEDLKKMLQEVKQHCNSIKEAIIVIVPNDCSANPINKQTFSEQNHFLRFTNKQVFEGGIQLFVKSMTDILQIYSHNLI